MRRLLLVGLLVGSLALGLLVLTPQGFTLFLVLLDRSLPGNVSARVEGALLGNWRVQDFHYRDDALNLQMARLQLDWQPWALLQGELRVDFLGAHGVQLTLPVATDDSPDTGTPSLRLPVGLAVQTAQLEDLQLRVGDGPATTLERVSLSAHTAAEALRFDLDVQTAEHRLRAVGELAAGAGLPMNAELQWDTQVAGAALAGAGAIQGSYQDGWQWQQTLTGALTGTLHGELGLVPGLRWQVAGRVTAEPTHVQPHWPVQNLGLDLQSSGTPEDFRLQGDASATLPTVGTVAGTFQLLHQGQQWRLQRLALTSDRTPLALTATGIIDPAAGTVSAEGGWQSLGWPLDSPTLGSTDGSFQLDGSPGDYRFGLDSDWWHDTLGEGRLWASGEGNRERVWLTGLRLSRMAGEDALLNATASLRYGDGAFRFEGHWQGLRWPMETPPTLTGGAGRLHLEGRLPARYLEGIAGTSP